VEHCNEVNSRFKLCNTNLFYRLKHAQQELKKRETEVKKTEQGYQKDKQSYDAAVQNLKKLEVTIKYIYSCHFAVSLT